MKISTKGRYALRLMLDLALQGNHAPVSIKSIAGRQNVSEKYLEQIIALLCRAGLVRSVRGAQGGYLLTKQPSEYTVGAILRLTEGGLYPVKCMQDDPNQCPRCETCATLEVWKSLYDAICGVVDHITLADLMEQHHRKAGGA